MPITTVGIGAAVTPTVIKTYLSHYADRKPRRQKPTAHIAYDEGLHLIRSFLDYASHHTVEDLQSFTAQWVPSPTWVRTENVPIPEDFISRAADTLIAELGESGVEQIGGPKWWQWRRPNSDLKGEWVEMRADYNARKQLNEKSKRVMLYIHGGAYFFGSVDEHRYQLQRHARKLKARVFAPRYRLAPQFPFPCGILDCLASYLYLLSLHDPSEIILAGDSAGGGMAVSILCMLRDQGLPLPAGAVLISPWVDLTHSFPSVAGSNNFDYIPAHGFMQKPSAAWPPPNDEDMEAIRKGAGETLLTEHNKLEKPSVQREQAQGVVVSDNTQEPLETQKPSELAGNKAVKTKVPGPSRHLSIQIDGKTVELRDQIQMYATNQLISHPLVSPVLQPSLGGLPPLLILTGGGEVLRDEQIYLAHKAANPSKYPLGSEYRTRYDPDDVTLNKYKPTPVQLQVWEDLCHVAPTLSFTRPAKYMYRSVAQFGAWALARAQNTSIELVDDDNISIISHSSSSDSEDHMKKREEALARRDTKLGAVGKAGEPIPHFKNHMIRQRVDRHGNIYPLDPTSELPALQLAANEVGVIKVGPVKKWMDARQVWDTKYARTKRAVQQRRIKDLTRRGKVAFDGQETPPPSALAGRQNEVSRLASAKPKKSFYLAMWSGWGSKHDEDTIKREQDFVEEDQVAEESKVDPEQPQVGAQAQADRNASRSRKGTDSKKQTVGDRSRSRRRTIAVRDQGQTNNEGQDTANGIVSIDQSNAQLDTTNTRSTAETDERTLNPLYIPKFRTQTHLKEGSKDLSDSASVRTGVSAFSLPDNASTMAVFAAPGVSKQQPNGMNDSTDDNIVPGPNQTRPRAPSADTTSTIRQNKRPGSALGGYDTPVSRRSVERLMSHQIEVTGVDGETASVLSTNALATSHTDATLGTQSAGNKNFSRIQMNRSPSSIAIVQAEGIVGVVEGGEADQESKDQDKGEKPPERPGMYDRTDTEFQTAAEKL